MCHLCSALLSRSRASLHVDLCCICPLSSLQMEYANAPDLPPIQRVEERKFTTNMRRGIPTTATYVAWESNEPQPRSGAVAHTTPQAANTNANAPSSNATTNAQKSSLNIPFQGSGRAGGTTAAGGFGAAARPPRPVTPRGLLMVADTTPFSLSR